MKRSPIITHQPQLACITSSLDRARHVMPPGSDPARPRLDPDLDDGHVRLTYERSPPTRRCAGGHHDQLEARCPDANPAGRHMLDHITERLPRTRRAGVELNPTDVQ